MGIAELEPEHKAELPDTPRRIALRVVADHACRHLLESGEAFTGRELLPIVNARIPVGPKTLKTALSDDPRISRDDRRWVSAAAEIDPKRPIERSVVSLIEAVGLPITVNTLGRWLSLAYSREEEAMADLVAKLVKGRPDFFASGDGTIGLSSWLLDASSGNEADVEFENFEDTSEIDALRSVAKEIDRSSLSLFDTAREILDRVDRPVSSKALLFILWRARPDRFNAAQLFRLLLERPDFHLVSPNAWIGPKTRGSLETTLDEIERTVDIELTNEDVPKPITVEPEDIDQMAAALTEIPVSAHELLQIRFPDLRVDDPNYNTTLSSLDRALRTDARFMWVGWDRWSAPRTVPDEVNTLPKAMEPVAVDVELTVGQLEDIELEDDGLEANLAEVIRRPIVRDGGVIEKGAEGVLRGVVTYAPRMAGVLPVGDDASIIPKQPDYLLAVTIDEAGEERTHWINTQSRLMFSLGEWYASVDLPLSGAVITLEPQGGPGRYLLLYNGDTDPDTHLEPARIKDLAALRERSVIQETSTREIIQEVLRYHGRGISFERLFAEVAVARVTSARMIASILSSYYEFYMRGNNWGMNERDAAKGFKKQKKKYLIRR